MTFVQNCCQYIYQILAVLLVISISINSVTHTHKHTHLHNGVNWTRLLAEAAVDAFGHVDVVTSCPPAAVGSSLCLDGDGLQG